VEGPTGSVDVEGSIPGNSNSFMIGSYHAHPNQFIGQGGYTLWSPEDIANQLNKTSAQNDKKNLLFQILTNCNGDRAWILINLPTTSLTWINGANEGYLRQYPDDLGQGKDWEAWQKKQEAALVAATGRHNLLAYKREGKSGAFTLMK
jgi:hypothetical protein